MQFHACGESKLSPVFRCTRCEFSDGNCTKNSDKYMTNRSFECDLYKRRGKASRPDPKETKEKLKVKYTNTDEVCYAFHD